VNDRRTRSQPPRAAFLLEFHMLTAITLIFAAALVLVEIAD
jgi:hypothetical protein